jgi:hypothetical protein
MKTIRAYYLIKEEQTKSIVISQDDLIDFIHTAKGTFGIFRVKRGDENFRAERYFLAYLVFWGLVDIGSGLTTSIAPNMSFHNYNLVSLLGAVYSMLD